MLERRSLNTNLGGSTLVIKLNNLVSCWIHEEVDLILVVVVAHVEAVRLEGAQRNHCVQRDRHQVAVLVLLEHVEAVLARILHEVALLLFLAVHEHQLAQRSVVQSEHVAASPGVDAALASGPELQRLEPHLYHSRGRLPLGALLFSGLE
jgi:hypothetical protein